MLNRATDYDRSFADGALQDPGLRDCSGIAASAATPWLVVHDDTLSRALFTADGLTIPGWIVTFALGLALLLSAGTNHLGVAAGMIFFAYAVLIGLIISILANLFVRSTRRGCSGSTMRPMRPAGARRFSISSCSSRALPVSAADEQSRPSGMPDGQGSRSRRTAPWKCCDDLIEILATSPRATAERRQRRRPPTPPTHCHGNSVMSEFDPNAMAYAAEAAKMTDEELMDTWQTASDEEKMHRSALLKAIVDEMVRRSIPF